MFQQYRNHDVLKQPKIYVPAQEKVPSKLPKYIKWIIIIIVILIGLSYLFFFSPIFQIKKVEIIGNPSNETIQYLNSFIKKNIFRLDAGQIQKDLEKNFPEYLEINVSRGLPNILQVKFTQRQAKIVWQSGSNYYLVDSNAFAFQKIDTPPDNLIKTIDNQNLIVNLPTQVATKNFIEFIQNTKSKLTNLQVNINYFEVNETTFQVSAVTDNNIKIIFDITRPLSDQIDAFGKVYAEHKEEIKQYIDLRVEGKVYYQ